MCTRTVFVGDLSYFCRESHLLQLFSSVGHVIDIDLKRNQEGESQLHAFVKFESEMSVPIAVEVYNGVKYMGRRMVVNGTSTRAQKKDYNNWYKLTIHFSATSDPNAVNENNEEINEEFLDMLCSPYGILGDVIIRSHTRTVLPSSVQMNPVAMRQLSRSSPPLGVSDSFSVNNNNNNNINGPLVSVVSGYGVVFFLELTGANRALQSLHNTTVNHNILLTCNLSPRPNDLLMSSNNATHAMTHASHTSPNTMYHPSQIPRHLHQSANNSNASSPRSFASSHSSPNLGMVAEKMKPLYNNANVMNNNYIANMRKSPASSPPQTFYPTHSAHNSMMNNVHNNNNYNNNNNNNGNVHSVHSSGNTHNMSPYQLQMLMQLEQQQQLLEQQKQMLLMKRSDSDLSRFTLQSNNNSNTVSNNPSHNNSFVHLLATSDDFSNNSKSSSFYNSSSSSLSHNSSFIGSNYVSNNNANNNNNSNMFNVPAINTAPNNSNVQQKFPTLYPSATTQTPKSYNSGHHSNNGHPVAYTSLHQHYLAQPTTQMPQNTLGMSGSFLGEPVSEFVAAPQQVPPSTNSHPHHHPNTYQPSLDIIQSLLASNSFSAEDQTHVFPVVNNNNFNNNGSSANNAHINDSQFEVDSLIN